MIRRLVIAGGCLLIGGGVVWLFQSQKPMAARVVEVVATRPAGVAATRVVKPQFPSYLEVVRGENAAVAATQPLDVAVELGDAAHLILHEPVYLDPAGHLWITRADGMPASKAIERLDDGQEHIILERPVYVHWWTDDGGNWQAGVVVRAAIGGYDLITKKKREHLADDRPYRWETAYSVLGKMVVSTDMGVSVFDLEPTVRERYHALPGCGSGTSLPVTLLDTRGVMAWSPWENGRNGSRGVSRFVEGEWKDLPAADWPARPIQLLMLLDGSVLRMSSRESGASPAAGEARGDLFADQIELSIGQVEPQQLDEKHVNELIDQLGDPDGEKRQAAFDELSRYGPGIAPLLDKAGDDILPEAKMRVRQLLANKITPALGGLIPVNQRLDVVRRCGDGTVIFFAPSGVQIPTEHDEPDVINPAWLALRPDGRMEQPLAPAIVQDQKVDACTLICVRDEWIRTDPLPQRLVGNRFEPLLSAGEKQFNQLVGISARRQWIFRDSAGETLIIDPLVADPTPRLPVWTIVTKGFAGWDSGDFPAVSRGGDRGSWELATDAWRPLGAGEKVTKTLPPATQPTTGLALGRRLLRGSDGAEYFDGKTSLKVVRSNGEQVNWLLPAAGAGTAEPTLMQTADGVLFLFNQGGRLLRIRPTPAGSEPFKLEAVFTKDIPNEDHPQRIWLDPAGRIVFITEDNLVSVAFPSGTIPREISRMMLDSGQ